KAVHTPAGNTPASDRLITASPNSFSPRVSFTGAIVSRTVPTDEVLTLPSAKPPAVRPVAGPQHGGLSLLTSQTPLVTQRRNVRFGTSVEPPSKSYTISMSPATRETRPSEAAGHAGPVAWLNSKPMWAEGEVVFWGIRTHARVRKTSPVASVLVPM